MKATEIVKKFQDNLSHIMISTIQTGSESISLHDKKGHYPRVSIISPSFSSIDLKQSLGRIYRTGTKSQCIQNLIYCADTYEEQICRTLNEKNKFMCELIDEDLI